MWSWLVEGTGQSSLLVSCSFAFQVWTLRLRAHISPDSLVPDQLLHRISVKLRLKVSPVYLYSFLYMIGLFVSTNTKGKECSSVLSCRLWEGLLCDDTKNGCGADYQPNDLINCCANCWADSSWWSCLAGLFLFWLRATVRKYRPTSGKSWKNRFPSFFVHK